MQVPDAVELRVPGAKYYTLRYLLAAFLAEGESRVRNPALSEDTAVLVQAIRALGGQVTWERDGDEGWAARVTGCGGHPNIPPGSVVHAGNAGAVLRFLLGIGALLPDIRFETDHPSSLGRRPNADLLAALESLGIAVESQGPDGLLPITLRGGPPRGGAVSVSGARSSQYASALLYLAPLLPDGLDLDNHGRPALGSAAAGDVTHARRGRNRLQCERRPAAHHNSRWAGVSGARVHRSRRRALRRRAGLRRPRARHATHYQ